MNPKAAQPHLQGLRDLLGPDPGTGRYVREGFEERSRSLSRNGLTEMSKTFQKYGLVDMSALDNAMLREAMLRGASHYEGEAIPDYIKAASGELRDQMEAMYQANKKAGLDLHYVAGSETNYLPREYDHAKISADPEGFIRQAKLLHQGMFDTDVGPPGENPDKLLERWRNLSAEDKALAEQDNPDITSGMRDLGRNLRRQKAINDQITQNNPPLSNAQIAALVTEHQQLQAAAEQLAAQHHNAVRDFIADTAATDWRFRIEAGYQGSFNEVGPSGNYLNHRVLPPEADEIMKDYMVTDLKTLLPSYVDKSARKIAYAERFGGDDAQGKNGVIESALRAATKAGMTDKDGQKFRAVINAITGRTQNNGQHVVSVVANFLHAFGAVPLMGRAVWSSLSEPMVAGLVHGNAEVGLRAFLHQFGEVFRTGGAKERAELADFLGVTVSRLSETIINSRLGTNYADTPMVGRAMQHYYRTSGITGMTNAIRRSVMGAQDWALRRYANHLLSGDASQIDYAKRLFNELGVPPRYANDFAAWVIANDGMPTVEDLKNDTTGMASIYSLVMRRLVDRSSQDPYKADRPMLAEDPWFRLVFQYQTYAYGFQRNVLEPMTHQLGRDFTQPYQRARGAGAGRASAGAQAAWNGMQGAMGFSAAAGVLVLGSLLATTGREAIYNSDKWEEHAKNGTLMEWLMGLAVSRSGLGGTLDMIGQMITGLKYTADMATILEGGNPKFEGQNVADLLRGLATILEPNAPETNAKLHAATRASYNLFAIPALALLATALGASKVPGAGVTSGFGLQALTSPQAAERFATWLTGPAGAKAAPPPSTELPGLDEGGGMQNLDELDATGAPGATKPGALPGGPIGGIPLGMLDDFIQPAVKVGRVIAAPVMAMLPPWAKVALGVAGTAAVTKHYLDAGAPYRDQPAAP
jgi:hypothetical protein